MHRTHSLSRALGADRGQLVSLVGGGGKTSALITIVHEAAAEGWTALASTTTRMGSRVEALMPVVFLETEGWREVLRRHVSERGSVFLAASRGDDGKLLGVDGNLLESVRNLADIVVVEADGAKQKPLKVPADHEPVMPAGTDIVSPVAGLDALGRAISDEFIHRAGLIPVPVVTDTVSHELIADIITCNWGGRKAVPRSASVRPMLNKTDLSSSAEGSRVAEIILSRDVPGLDRVLITSLATEQYAFIEAG